MRYLVNYGNYLTGYRTFPGFLLVDLQLSKSNIFVGTGTGSQIFVMLIIPCACNHLKILTLVQNSDIPVPVPVPIKFCCIFLENLGKKPILPDFRML